MPDGFIPEPNVIGLLAQHFVVLRIEHDVRDATGDFGPRKAAILSGFLLEVRNVIFWVTAGHCLKIIDDGINAGQLRVHEATFMDHFGLRAINSHGIPFHYEVGCGHYIDEGAEGLDYALIAIDRNKQSLFEANGLVPVGRANWATQSNLTFDFYRMLGVPEDQVISTPLPNGSLDTKFRLALLAVNRIGMDEVGKPPPDATVPTDAWFIGRIHPECSIRDIRGMSGGPIYGFRVSDGSMYFHCVAVQSRWWDRSRTIFGTSLPRFAEFIHEQLGVVFAEFAAQEGEQSDINPT